ncbi:MAG: hypothetical protein QM758_09305 [Armatimonas sp.]
MRRRPRAAAEDAPSVDPTEQPIEATTESVETPTPEKPKRTRRTAKKADETEAAAPVEAALAEEKPKRTRRVVAKKTEEPAPEAVVEVEAPAVEAEATPVPAPEKPRRTRRTVAKKATDEAPIEPVETPTVEAVAEAAPAPVEKPRRTRRTRTAVTAEPIVAETPAEEPVSLELEAPVVEEAPAPVAETKPSRNRNRRGKKGSAEPTQATEESATGEEGDDAETAGGSPRRTRGLRRTRTVAAPTLMVNSSEPEVPVEEDPEAEALASRRTRGRRRERTTNVVATIETPLRPIPTPEPLPPPYVPLPAEVLANLAETKLEKVNGVVELSVSGETRLPLWFFVNTEMDPEARPLAQRQIRLAYEAGVRIFTVLAHLPWKNRAGERRYDLLDDVLGFVAENAPDALILPRLIFSPPGSFIRANPGDMVRYASGEEGDISIASRKFWEVEADEALRAAVEHIAQGQFAGRVLGFYLEHGEWLYDKGLGFDASEANQQGFKSWLRQKYKNSLVSLRAAWHDGSVTFETANVPEWPVPPGNTIFFGAREGRYIDFHEYSSEIAAQTILRLGKAVKEASGGRSAVAVSYGYTLELPRAYSGHLALRTVLDSPYVDILTGPISYSGRHPGGSAPPPAPIDSVTLAGKLWVCEDDTKTPLATGRTPDGYNPKIETDEGVRACHARNMGAAIVKGVGLSWMDLWGEGWLDSRETWQELARLRQLAELAAARRTRPMGDPQVAVVVDERAFFSVRDESLLETLIASQRDALLRLGVRVGFYLLSDIQKRDFPLGAKLVLFLNAFSLDNTTRAAIAERLQNEGRTLAWVFAPCANEETISECADVIGQHVKLQPWSSKMGSTVLSNVHSPLTEHLRGQVIGDPRRLNPSFSVADLRSQVLAEYPGGGAAIAVRKHPRWQSVFLGEPGLTRPLLRGLLRLAGIAPLTVDDDVAWIGDGVMCLHSTEGGGTNVYLPEEGAVYDGLTGETLTSGGWGARLSMPLRGTRLLFWGEESSIAALGGDIRTALPGLTRAELPPAPAPFVFESGSGLPVAEISAEDEALFLAALEGELLPDKDSEAPEEAEESATATETEAEAGERRKRRRRRRGRGRNGEEEISPEELAEVLVTESVEPLAAEPARIPPPLEELLPDSEVPEGVELPTLEEFTEETTTRRPRRRRGRAAQANEEGTEGE